MVKRIIKRVSQLIRAYLIGFNKNITLFDKWNFRLSPRSRVGGEGRIVFLGGGRNS